MTKKVFSASTGKIIACHLFTMLLLQACSSTPEKEAEPEKITQAPTIKVPATELTGGVPGSVLEKPLITIIISTNKILVNNKVVNSTKAIEKELKKFNRPAIAIRAHKCANAALSTKIMNLAQDHTDTPIPFGSFGRFDDKGC